ncbi:MAG: hypothetical protein JWQ71_340 [Pedosphaera sp.]|nr:hypothetical protein [Pedosphaera sp.]
MQRISAVQAECGSTEFGWGDLSAGIIRSCNGSMRKIIRTSCPMPRQAGLRLILPFFFKRAENLQFGKFCDTSKEWSFNPGTITKNRF